ncbi:MAG: site-specific DNA-methyltransferase [Planctomycetes bacterium]|nr:site-specific DNA-methyltransferase [Planctomycetota bacterium]
MIVCSVTRDCQHDSICRRAAHRSWRLQVPPAPHVNQIVLGDCIEQMRSLPKGSVDLVFADPPFNIGYDYDVYRDDRECGEYLKWSKKWIAAVHRVVKDTGAFWLAIGDEYAAELKIISQEAGFTCRSWVIWYYTFGVNCKTKFSRSHAHLFYFVKDAKSFTFRAEDLDNRIPSARQLVYADNRANPTGRLPDDTWVLRPQDMADCFTPGEDTWYFPRVAGTFKERAGFHGCQMPEQLLGRIIRLCSNEGELVLDPFSGSATTVAVAKKLGRKYLGFDLSSEYVARGLARLEQVCVGDSLEGSAEPTLSAPATPSKQGGRPSVATSRRIKDDSPLTLLQKTLYQKGLLDAFRAAYRGYSVDRVVADPDINAEFVGACGKFGLPGDARNWNWTLLGMRKTGAFADIPTLNRTEIDYESCDAYSFASEIAWGQLVDQGCASLDTILCDPNLAKRFDEIARMWAPGFTPLEYRWAALKLRKRSKDVRSRAKLLTDAHLSRGEPLNKHSAPRLPDSSGVYIVFGKDSPIYAGEANNLRERISRQFGDETEELWRALSRSLTARFFPTDCAFSTRLAYQRRLVNEHKPKLNLPDSKI